MRWIWVWQTSSLTSTDTRQCRSALLSHTRFVYWLSHIMHTKGYSVSEYTLITVHDFTYRKCVSWREWSHRYPTGKPWPSPSTHGHGWPSSVVLLWLDLSSSCWPLQVVNGMSIDRSQLSLIHVFSLHRSNPKTCLLLRARFFVRPVSNFYPNPQW